MAAPRKPRIALMGEFSAGKSTLSNLLLGARPLPEKVTATRLSPVWMAHGTDSPYSIGVDGAQTPVALAHLQDIPVDQTRVIRLFMEADILEICDLIDFPGISDPNMASTVWERMLPEVDAVIWCTHANQAWRQSEAAVWDTMPDIIRQKAILLITRFDKLVTDNDRRRVYKRVVRETNGLFEKVYPVSLLDALAAGENLDAWNASGAGAFVTHLIDLIEELTDLVSRAEAPLYNIPNGSAVPQRPVAPVTPRRVERPLNTTTPRPPAGEENADTGPLIRS